MLYIESQSGVNARFYWDSVIMKTMLRLLRAILLSSLCGLSLPCVAIADSLQSEDAKQFHDLSVRLFKMNIDLNLYNLSLPFNFSSDQEKDTAHRCLLALSNIQESLVDSTFAIEPLINIAIKMSDPKDTAVVEDVLQKTLDAKYRFIDLRIGSLPASTPDCEKNAAYLSKRDEFLSAAKDTQNALLKLRLKLTNVN